MDATRFEDLLGRLLDEAPTGEELAELTRLAEDHPTCRAELRSQLEVAEMLAQAEDTLRDSPRFVAATLDRLGEDPFVAGVRLAIARGAGATPETPRGRKPRWTWTVAAAVLVALVAGLAWLRPSDEPPMARITALNGSTQWTGDGGRVKVDLEVGRPLGGGTLESLSAESWAVLEFRDGSTVTVSGPSMLTIADGPQKELHLRKGSLSASVAHQPAGKGMMIHTPTARLEVVGTQLNVEAESSSTLVNVNEGLVRITRLVDGRVAEVPADYQIVTSLNRRVDFKARRRPEPADSWTSDLPKDAKYGRWLPGQGEDANTLRAWPMLLTTNRPEPLLIYLTSFSVDSDDSPPVLPGAGGRFRFRGRLEASGELYFGLTMHHPKGGFAGKYLAARKMKVAAKSDQAFDFELRLEEFKPERAGFPPVPNGLELVDCWCVTLREDLGLSISRVELVSSRP